MQLVGGADGFGEVSGCFPLSRVGSLVRCKLSKLQAVSVTGLSPTFDDWSEYLVDKKVLA